MSIAILNDPQLSNDVYDLLMAHTIDDFLELSCTNSISVLWCRKHSNIEQSQSGMAPLEMYAANI
uniref:RNase H domain-containing protein n=1 Tax=Heterorhabditis bacteriophora TaxID=37862 RepID=A0A1I7XU27_HETBA